MSPKASFGNSASNERLSIRTGGFCFSSFGSSAVAGSASTGAESAESGRPAGSVAFSNSSKTNPSLIAAGGGKEGASGFLRQLGQQRSFVDADRGVPFFVLRFVGRRRFGLYRRGFG
jgi:hypothetical protein